MDEMFFFPFFSEALFSLTLESYLSLSHIGQEISTILLKKKTLSVSVFVS